jgi:hypothetical protein
MELGDAIGGLMRGRRITSALLGLMLGTAARAAPPVWNFSTAAFGYIVPDDADYLQPSGTADRGVLHLEGRYNYEELETGSLWAGYNLGGGEAVTFELTPMLGAAFGATGGIAPGYRLSLEWRRLGLSSEGEYLFDFADRADSFFYTWSELTISTANGIRAGLVLQKTRAYESPREVQRGFLVGFHFRRAEIAAYLFNPDDDRPLGVVSVSAAF